MRPAFRQRIVQSFQQRSPQFTALVFYLPRSALLYPGTTTLNQQHKNNDEQ
jgi:hypothetical protein